MRLTEFHKVVVFDDYIPSDLKMEEGVLYYCPKLGGLHHLCPCGCGEDIYIWDNGTSDGWKIEYKDGKITASPSLGNFHLPCKSHYFIRENKIIWV